MKEPLVQLYGKAVVTTVLSTLSALDRVGCAVSNFVIGERERERERISEGII